MNYAKAKSLFSTLESGEARMEIMGPGVDIKLILASAAKVASKYIYKSDTALAAFTERLTFYRGRPLNDAEHAVYNIVIYNYIDEIKANHKHASGLYACQPLSPDIPIIIQLEQEFKKRIPGYTVPPAASSSDETTRAPAPTLAQAGSGASAVLPKTYRSIAANLNWFLRIPLSQLCGSLTDSIDKLTILDEPIHPIYNHGILDLIKNKLMESDHGKMVLVAVPIMNTGCFSFFTPVRDYLVFQRQVNPAGSPDAVTTRTLASKDLRKLFPEATTATAAPVREI